MRIMFVGEYYRYPTELKIESHAHHQHYGTALEHITPKFTITFVFCDAGFIQDSEGKRYRYAHEGDMINAIRQFNPEVIFFSPIAKKVEEPSPDRVILAYIAWKMNKKCIGIAHDLGISSTNMWDRYYPMMYKILQIEGFDTAPHTMDRNRWVKMFAPHIDGFDTPPTRDRSILISCTGRPNDERIQLFSDIKDRGIDVWHRDFKDYENCNMPNIPLAEINGIQSDSKMVLSDSFDHKWKGRAWEGAMCGALVFEYEDCAFKNWFEPYSEFVPYSNVDDLCDKIRYYERNEEERMVVAQAGYDRWKNNYTGQHFWDKILREIV